MIQLTLILDNIRSSHNVGSILRTADAAGVERVICSGITPYPRVSLDERDPVAVNRNTREIAKTALGAEMTVSTEHIPDTLTAITAARAEGRTIYGLEQTPVSQNALRAGLRFPAALVLGSETTGLSAKVIAACDEILEIPQFGGKESLNVSVAAGIAVYEFVRLSSL